MGVTLEQISQPHREKGNESKEKNPIPDWTNLFWCELLLYAHINDIKRVRGNNGRVHVAIVDKVTHNLQDVIFIGFREFGMQEKAKLHGNIPHGISIEIYMYYMYILYIL